MSFLRVVAAIGVALALVACSPFGGEKSGETPEAGEAAPTAAPDQAAKPEEPGAGASMEAAKPEDAPAPAPGPAPTAKPE